MSIVKSLSVGDGDMFYIRHGSSNFTIIDCCINEEIGEDIIEELKSESKNKGITRFISTHPDEDHLRGFDYLDDKLNIVNFYCVKNKAIKKKITPDFKPAFERYCELRDDQKKCFHLHNGCGRKWMNQSGKNDDGIDHGCAGLNVLWPILDNKNYQEELIKANNGEAFNNISIILEYNLENGASMLWMGDMETDFMNNIEDDFEPPKIDILFAPHHGRKTGKVPEKWLKKMQPKIIVLGEADSEDLNYYQGYSKISQNSAKDITFECIGSKVHIYVSNENYSVDFLDDEGEFTYPNYIGTLNIV